MKLALDSSQNFGSIALAGQGKLIYSSFFSISITHSETLMPQVDYALKFCGCKPSDLEAVYFSQGPGSFTGLRIGLATWKGLAYANRRPIAGVSSLAAMAMGAAASARSGASSCRCPYRACWRRECLPLFSRGMSSCSRWS